jgi:hypothetical protein
VYVPKKINWNSLTDFKEFLLKNTNETIVKFDGLSLETTTTKYMMLDSTLVISPVEKQEVAKRGKRKTV